MSMEESVMYGWHAESLIYHITLDGNTALCGIPLKGWLWCLEGPGGLWKGFHKTLCLNCERTRAYKRLAETDAE